LPAERVGRWTAGSTGATANYAGGSAVTGGGGGGGGAGDAARAATHRRFRRVGGTGSLLAGVRVDHRSG